MSLRKQTAIPLLFSLLVLGGIFWENYKSLAATGGSVDATIKISICGNHIREGGEQCDLNNLGGKTCSRLGFSGGDLSCSSACGFDTSGCVTDAEVVAEPTFTPSDGGSHTLDNGDHAVEIIIPENFYSHDLQLEVFSRPNDSFAATKPAPAEKDFVGKTYDFIFINPEGESVTALLQPATIVLTYTDSDVTGIDEGSLTPYRWGSNDASWQLIPGAEVDTVNNQITFSTASFSSFALFGSPEEESSVSNPSVGGGGGSFYALPSYIAYPLSEVPVLIALAPTIAIDKNEVEQGENLAIFGQGAPLSLITIGIDSQDNFAQTQTDANGFYLYNLNTALINGGDHTIRSKSASGNQVSFFGKTISFKIETETAPAAESPYLLKNQDLDTKIYVKEADDAGDEKVVTLPAKNPWPYENYAIAIAIIIALGVVLFYAKKLKAKSRS